MTDLGTTLSLPLRSFLCNVLRAARVPQVPQNHCAALLATRVRHICGTFACSPTTCVLHVLHATRYTLHSTNTPCARFPDCRFFFR
ncbi:hypothetical protein F5Y11DRAFT_199841 [Daldinia sp. FL1419]|nr:hypothetical protein F5Y11DRAFT_199841 [Daldinia sp. FL1419]